MYTTVGHNLPDYLQNLPILEQESVAEYLRLNKYKFTDFNNAYNQSETINTFDSFYYNFGRFPGDSNLISVAPGDIKKFIKSNGIISHLTFYGKYLGEDMRSLFLAVLNIFLGGRLSISKDAMSELFCNLSYEALRKDNDKYKLEFTAITLLVKRIIYKLEQKTKENKFKAEEIEREIQG